ncbi:MAG: efflux RND transporter permease subunit [Methanomicrobiales archaeon]
MKRLYARIADGICARPAVIAIAFMMVFLAALYGMGQTTMETGMDTYIDVDTPRGSLLKTYTDTFSSDSIMVLVETDNVLDPDVIRYIDRLISDMSDEQYISGTLSIASLFRQANGGDLPASSAEIAAVKSRVPAGTWDRYIPSNMMTIGVLTLEPGTSTETQNQILKNLEAIIRISSPPPGVDVTLTGNPAFQKQMREEMGQSMATLIAAAMVLMIIAVGFLFSHVRYRFLPVGIVGAGLVLTFGVMGLAGIPISMVVIGAFPVLIGIGIDYAIQFHARFDEERRRSDLKDAARTTITSSGPAILYAMLATALGFVAMWIAPIPMIRDFGIVCIIGIVCCYLAALVMVPTVGLLTGYEAKNNGKGVAASRIEAYDLFLGRFSGRIARIPVLVVVVVGLVAGIGLQLDSQIPINADEETFVPPDMPALIDLNKVERTMGSTETLPLYIRGSDVLTVDSIRWIDDFSTFLVEHNPSVTGSSSIASTLASYNNGELPATDREIDQVLQRIPEETRERYLQGSMDTVVQFSLVQMENEQALSLVRNVEHIVAWHPPPPGTIAQPTGMLEMFARLMIDIKETKTQMTLLAIGLIFTFLLLLYRKVTAISPVIPIIFIVGWNGAIMYLLGIAYTPLTAVLGSMTIGVASEYTILIMERFQEERALGEGLVEAIQTSVQKIGTAITASGLTTVFGFSALILSTFNIVKNFGLVTVITVAFSLIGAIVVMPAVLALMDRFQRKVSG